MADPFAFFIEIIDPRRKVVADPDPVEQPAPHHRGIRMGLQLNFPAFGRLDRIFSQQRHGIILIEIGFPHQVVIGKIRAVPGLQHHRRRHLDGGFGILEVVPHLVADLQGLVAGFFLGRADHDQGFFIADPPALHLHGAGVVRRGHRHLDGAAGAVAFHRIFGFFDDLLGRLGKEGQAQQGAQDDRFAVKHIVNSFF